MDWFDSVRKERPHYNPDELTVAQVKDFLRRFRLEYLPKLKGQLQSPSAGSRTQSGSSS